MKRLFRSWPKILVPLALLVFFAILIRPAGAQVAGGSISGTIVDPVSVPGAGAKVTVADKPTGTSRELTTSPNGLYSAPNLTPSIYQVEVSAAGFSTVQRSDISVLRHTSILWHLHAPSGC